MDADALAPSEVQKQREKDRQEQLYHRKGQNSRGRGTEGQRDRGREARVGGVTERQREGDKGGCCDQKTKEA